MKHDNAQTKAVPILILENRWMPVASCTMLCKCSGLFFRPNIFLNAEWVHSIFILSSVEEDCMWLRCGFSFFFEGRTVMCFSQSSLYCCQRRWSGCIDKAIVRSLGTFYRLSLNRRKFFLCHLYLRTSVANLDLMLMYKLVKEGEVSADVCRPVILGLGY